MPRSSTKMNQLDLVWMRRSGHSCPSMSARSLVPRRCRDYDLNCNRASDGIAGCRNFLPHTARKWNGNNVYLSHIDCMLWIWPSNDLPKCFPLGRSEWLAMHFPCPRSLSLDSVHLRHCSIILKRRLVLIVSVVILQRLCRHRLGSSRTVVCRCRLLNHFQWNYRMGGGGDLEVIAWKKTTNSDHLKSSLVSARINYLLVHLLLRVPPNPRHQ